MSSHRHTRNRRSLIHWVFQRGRDRVACQINSNRSFFTVTVVSKGKNRLPFAETFRNGLEAFARHAEIARDLREFGWQVASYSR